MYIYKQNKTKKQLIVSLGQNSTVVPIFQNLSLFMSVFYCVSRKYFRVLWQ